MTTFPLSEMMTRMEENRKNIPRDKPNEGATAGLRTKDSIIAGGIIQNSRRNCSCTRNHNEGDTIE
jgi:hypothetical protein